MYTVLNLFPIRIDVFDWVIQGIIVRRSNHVLLRQRVHAHPTPNTCIIFSSSVTMPTTPFSNTIDQLPGLGKIRFSAWK